MDKISGIYCITNNINGKQYIGLSKDCHKRWQDHYSKSYTSEREDDVKKALYRAMRKYGRENFSFRILEECPEEKLKEREIYWIKKLDTYNKGYNETYGGDNYSPEHVLRGEAHGMAKLTEQDVIQCRICYQQGLAAKTVWERFFSNKVTFPGFQRMWHGKTWKHVMPEVFEEKKRPKQKWSSEIKAEILRLYNEEHKSCAEIYHIFNEEISRTTIHDYCHGKR